MKKVIRLAVVFIGISSSIASANYDDTVRRGEEYHASEEYRREVLAQQEAERARNAPSRNQQFLRETSIFAKRYHRGLATQVAQTVSDDGLYITRVDFSTGDGYECKGTHENASSVTFSCVHPRTFQKREEHFTHGFLH